MRWQQIFPPATVRRACQTMDTHTFVSKHMSFTLVVIANKDDVTTSWDAVFHTYYTNAIVGKYVSMVAFCNQSHLHDLW
jgi:hypothetical protein